MMRASRSTTCFTTSFLQVYRRVWAPSALRPRLTGSASSRCCGSACHAIRSSPRQWPADFQLKIAAIADLHACDPWMSLDRIEAIVERTNALNADVIVMLGDYVAGHRHVTRFIPAERMGAGARRAEGAARRARDPRQSRLLGRQDGAARRARADRGAPRARGRRHSGLRERRRAPDQGRPAVLARRARRSTGLFSGAAFSAGARASASTISRATLAKVTDDAPVILLAHEPDVALRVPSRVALQLSGHTHGGQVRLLGWSPAVPSGTACGSPTATCA